MTRSTEMLRGDTVYRIHWVLGTDRLLAVCHCHAEREFEDPVQLWDWLLAHPVGHHTDLASIPTPNPPSADIAPRAPAHI